MLTFVHIIPLIHNNLVNYFINKHRSSEKLCDLFKVKECKKFTVLQVLVLGDKGVWEDGTYFNLKYYL